VQLSNMTIVERSRLYSVVSQIIMTPLDLENPISFTWHDRCVCVHFNDFKFLDLPPASSGETAQTVPEMLVEKYMNEGRPRSRRSRQPFSRTRSFSTSDCDSVSSDSCTQHRVESTSSDLVDHASGSALNSAQVNAMVLPTLSSDFPAIFMKGEGLGSFRADEADAWQEHDVFESSSQDLADAERSDWLDGSQLNGLESEFQFEYRTEDMRDAVTRDKMTPGTSFQRFPSYWKSLPDISSELPLPFKQRDDLGLGCHMQRLSTSCSDEEIDVLDFLKPHSHMVKGDVLVMYPSRANMCAYFHGLDAQSSASISSVLVFDDNPMLVKGINQSRSSSSTSFPVVAKDLNEESACEYIRAHPHRFDSAIHLDVDTFIDLCNVFAAAARRSLLIS